MMTRVIRFPGRAGRAGRVAGVGRAGRAGRGVLAVAVGLALAGIFSGVAVADPTYVPAATDVVSVGAPGLQAFDSSLSSSFNSQWPAPSSKYYSWDSSGLTPIELKTGCLVTTRPGDDAAGIAVLNGPDNFLSLSTGHRACVDTVRTETTPSVFSQTDTFIGFARDAIGWAGHNPGTGIGTSYSPPTLSPNDLVAIYRCQYTNWSQITDIPGYVGQNRTIHAYLPAIGDEVRTDFLASLGVTGLLGTCLETYNPTSDEGTDPVFNDPSVIFPYSIGRYVGQVYYGQGNGAMQPGYLDAARSVLNPSGTGGIVAQVNAVGHRINATFANSSFGWNLYHAVLTQDWKATPIPGTESGVLHQLFGPANPGSTPVGFVCADNASAATQLGFLALPPALCGMTVEGQQP